MGRPFCFRRGLCFVAFNTFLATMILFDWISFPASLLEINLHARSREIAIQASVLCVLCVSMQFHKPYTINYKGLVMNKLSSILATAIFSLAIGVTSLVAGDNPMVGGEAMFTTKDIVDNAVKSKDHTTLVAAVKTAGLVETLKGKGPFTVFAPTNAAFSQLPVGTVETLLKSENKATLTNILTYHVVAGRVDFSELSKWIKKGNGTAELKTVSGGKLWAMMNGERNIVIKDEKGNVANISTYDVYQSNGVIQVVDAVLMPK
jgi:uncharacterized surface protein with fasciclin (FAS1) repeats